MARRVTRWSLLECSRTTRRQWLAGAIHLSWLVTTGSASVIASTPALAQSVSATKAATVPAAATPGPTVLVVGDSLSAEYGLRRGEGWVALLEKRLANERPLTRVANASISGETTAGGVSRMPGLLKQHRPSWVIIELGGNDALRGLPLNMTRDNLTRMTREAKAAGARVLLLGMQVPPNYGRGYADAFSGLFAAVAAQENVGLVPFLLAGVADRSDAERFFQTDRIHPNALAHPQMLANVWDQLGRVLK
jgi:acyl-CoA thioesterase I